MLYHEENNFVLIPVASVAKSCSIFDNGFELSVINSSSIFPIIGSAQ